MSETDQILTTLRRALPELQRRWPIQTLSVFGSVVRGDATADSDLDVLVEFGGPVTLSEFLGLEETLAKLAGRHVDLVSRPALKRFIAQHVLDEAICV